jgi:hypothetical protein
MDILSMNWNFKISVAHGHKINNKKNNIQMLFINNLDEFIYKSATKLLMTFSYHSSCHFFSVHCQGFQLLLYLIPQHKD